MRPSLNDADILYHLRQIGFTVSPFHRELECELKTHSEYKTSGRSLSSESGSRRKSAIRLEARSIHLEMTRESSASFHNGYNDDAPADRPRIIIIDADITGLILAQALKRNDIPFAVFERDPSISARGRGWGLTIH